MAEILIVATGRAAEETAIALRRALDVSVALAPNRAAAPAALRQSAFALVVLDESAAGADLEAAHGALDLIYSLAGAATVIEVNLTLDGLPRTVRQVRAALHRREREAADARSAAAETLYGELNASLTGILLESQLALREATPLQSPKLQHLVQLAENLRLQLRQPR